jgi:hypothetical protein
MLSKPLFAFLPLENQNDLANTLDALHPGSQPKNALPYHEFIARILSPFGRSVFPQRSDSPRAMKSIRLAPAADL